MLLLNRVLLFLQEGKQLTLGTFDELSQKKFDVQSLISSGSMVEKEWDRDSAIDFEEVRVTAKKTRSPSNVSRQSSHSAVSHVNLSFVSEDPLPSIVVGQFVKVAFVYLGIRTSSPRPCGLDLIRRCSVTSDSGNIKQMFLKATFPSLATFPILATFRRLVQNLKTLSNGGIC